MEEDYEKEGEEGDAAEDADGKKKKKGKGGGLRTLRENERLIYAPQCN